MRCRVGKAKKARKAAARQEQIADELFAQVQKLSGDLAVVDRILTNAVLEGPTIDAWAAQVRIILTALVQARGLVAGPVASAFSERYVGPLVGNGKRQGSITVMESGTVPVGSVIEGEYTLLTDAEVAAGR